MGNRIRKEKKVLTNEELNLLIEQHGGDITLQEIGDIYNVTRMRVCQIEKQSLQKLAETAILKALR
jgi:DNA-directed RNA polymerase sigma subunit (sigma70/sigma32)